MTTGIGCLSAVLWVHASANHLESTGHSQQMWARGWTRRYNHSVEPTLYPDTGDQDMALSCIPSSYPTGPPQSQLSQRWQ